MLILYFLYYILGRQRSRMLATLFKDERCQQLPAHEILEKMYCIHYFLLCKLIYSFLKLPPYNTVLLRINTGGVYLIFDILWGAFIQGRPLLQNTEKVTIIYISTSMISSSSSIRKTPLSASLTSESVIRSNGLERSGSSNTSSCDINCSLPFWQGSPSLKQWIKPSSEPLVLSLNSNHTIWMSWKRGSLFEGGVYKIIWEKMGAFIQGRRFLEVGRLF